MEKSVAFIVPGANPPCSDDLVRKSPNVAPKGLVKIKASQNRKIRFIFVR